MLPMLTLSFGVFFLMYQTNVFLVNKNQKLQGHTNFPNHVKTLLQFEPHLLTQVNTGSSRFRFDLTNPQMMAYVWSWPVPTLHLYPPLFELDETLRALWCEMILLFLSYGQNMEYSMIMMCASGQECVPVVCFPWTWFICIELQDDMFQPGICDFWLF